MTATGATFKLLSSRVYLKGQKLNSLGLRFSNLDSGSAHEYKTSVSKTIRKPPLAEAQTALEKQKQKYGEKQRFTIIWWMEFFHPQCGTWLWDDMTLKSPGGSTLQCGMWLWDDMPLKSVKRPPYWNSNYGFDFDHITTDDMSFCSSLRNYIQIGPPMAGKWRQVDFQDGRSLPAWILGVQ